MNIHASFRSLIRLCAAGAFVILAVPGAFAGHSKPKGLTGTGTTGTIPVWTGAKSLGNSAITQFGDNIGIGLAMPAAQLHLVGGGIFVDGGTVGIAVNAQTGSGGEAIYGECTTANNNCYSVEGYAPAGDYAAYFYGGKGAYLESDDLGYPAVDAVAYGTNSYAVSGISNAYRAGYFKSSDNGLYSLFVDTEGGPTQATSGLEVNGSIRVEGNLFVAGSKAGYVVDEMQNADSVALEQGDVVVIAADSGPAVLGTIPVPRVKLATSANDTAVVGVVDAMLYVPDAATRSGYEAQQQADHDAAKQTQPTEKSRENKIAPMAKMANIANRISDAAGTMHADSNATNALPGGYCSVVTLGSFKMVKVDSSFGAIKAGDLLTTSPHAGYAMKVSDKLAASGAIIGKALSGLTSGTGTVSVLVTLK